MKKLILSFLLIFLFSCNQPYQTYHICSFVWNYVDVENIGMRIDPKDKMVVSLLLRQGGGFWSVKIGGESKIVYDKLCEKHGDITYYRKVRIYTNKLYDLRCAEDFVNMEITSSSDWDADHPAGSSLGDIVRFVSDSPLPYIRSGYTKKYSEEKGGEYYPIDKLVSELTPDDMMLLPMNSWSDKYFHFTQSPTLSREHTLTVRLTTDEGKVFTASVDAVF